MAAASVALLAVVLAAMPASAQVGLGAERYEVTITPPKRPGSEPEAAAPQAAPSPDAASPTPDSAAGAAAAASPSPSDAASASAPPPAAPPPPRPPQNLPLRTLQVGAFRQSASAESLKERLSASFSDVSIVEVQSGGEPLYRVNVGRLPHGPELDDLRRRLVAAGHPAFEVPAPTMPAAN